jgi:hypothetical protein
MDRRPGRTYHDWRWNLGPRYSARFGFDVQKDGTVKKPSEEDRRKFRNARRRERQAGFGDTGLLAAMDTGLAAGCGIGAAYFGATGDGSRALALAVMAVVLGVTAAFLWLLVRSRERWDR